MGTQFNQLVEELNKKLGDQPFYTLRQLTSIGFFGTTSAARKALKSGKLAFVKISPRRCVVPRNTLLDYLRCNLSEKKLE